MEAFDALELQLSQSVPVVLPQTRGLPSEGGNGSGLDLEGDEIDGLGNGSGGNDQGMRI